MKATVPSTRRGLAMAVALALPAASALAFDSGSTGADGVFTPQVDTELQLPPDGIFNFTSVDIPEGVTVTFRRNVTNTPVTILASGDVTIEGMIDVSGSPSAHVGAAGDGNLGDDGVPGRGGPGGFDGGRGGSPGENQVDRLGSAGLGPGGGGRARGGRGYSGGGNGGGGAGFGGSGGNGNSYHQGENGIGGEAYGVPSLLPMVGGSGGGGASAGIAFGGSGGGGGGGALLIASSTTVHISGELRAHGGASGSAGGERSGGSGGGGSGGAIRISATTLSGNGQIRALGGGGGGVSKGYGRGGWGSQGRIRLEAETMLRTAATDPAYSFDQPGEIFVAGMPTLRIASVAGTDAPAAPTGSADIVLPEDTPNPVTVTFQTSGIPLGNTVTLKVVPSIGAATEVVSNALAGTESNATAEAEVDIPDGPSVLQASVSFTVVEDSALSTNLSRFTNGEPVASVTVDAGTDAPGTTKLITVSGREFTWPSNAVAMQ